MDQIKDLIKKLDARIQRETYGVYVYRLKYTEADKMSATLQKIFQAQGQTSSARPAAGGGGIPGAGGQPGISGISSPSGPSLLGGISTVPPTIVDDKLSNSIIVVTDRNTFGVISQLLDRLDQRRPQVLIKAHLVEIVTGTDFDLGIELANFVSPHRDVLAGGAKTSLGLLQIALPQAGTTGTTGTTAATPITITPAGGVLDGLNVFLFKDRFTNIVAILKAVKGIRHVNVLEEPMVVAADNEQAQIKVGDQVPVPTQSAVQGVGIVTTFDKVVEANTVLTISPHVSDHNTVNLNVELQVDKFGAAIAQNAPPPQTKRFIKSSVKIPNGRTVILGGLHRSDFIETIRGVPWLMDVPILGRIFKRTSDLNTKATLYVFLTPYVVFDEKFGDYVELSRKFRTDAEEKRGLLQIKSSNCKYCKANSSASAGLKKTS
jgi:general secretion pathway protein D